METKLCRLCRQSCERLAQAHIFPRGFFSTLPEKGRVDSINSSGDKGRRLQNAIYDPDILCDRCEHDVMEPLDNYAIKVIRDKTDAFRISVPADPAHGVWVFNNADKRVIRAFIASVLWRSSVSRQLELKDVSIGGIYEERIRVDLLKKGDFNYVDMVLFYLMDPLHGGFFMPCRERLHPVDQRRDAHNINGWRLQLPNILITVSLDKRPHPWRTFWVIDPSLSGQANGCRVSTSLLTVDHDYDLMAFEFPRNENIIAQMAAAVKGSQMKLHNKPIQTR